MSEDKAVADPPLLRLEVEAAHAYLSTTVALLALCGQTSHGSISTPSTAATDWPLGVASNVAGPGPGSLALSGSSGKSVTQTAVPGVPYLPAELAVAVGAQARMVHVCMASLNRFTLGVRHELHGPMVILQRSNGPSGAAGSDAYGLGSSGTSDRALLKQPKEFLAIVTGAQSTDRERERTLSGANGLHPQPPPLPPRYIVVGRTHTGAPVLMAPPPVEFATFTALVASALRALGELQEDAFRK